MGDPDTADVTVPDTSTGCWVNAGTHTKSASARVIPTARRKRVPWNVSFMARSSSCGSSHGLEALLGDQFAIRHEVDVVSLEGDGRGGLTEHGKRRAGGKRVGRPTHTTDVRGNEVTAQCHAPALLQRDPNPHGILEASRRD